MSMSSRCSSPPVPGTVLGAGLHSWDSHTEQDIENILLAGHAVISTMEVAEDLQHYTRGVYYSQQCQNWRLGPDRCSLSSSVCSSVFPPGTTSGSPSTA